MPRNYDETDLFWTKRGDLMLSDKGDLADTFEDPLRSVVQEVLTRLKSSKRGWSLYPNVGADISDFVGEPNTKVTAENIKTRIISALTYNGLVSSQDLQVRYMPIDIDQIMFRISIQVTPTARNRGSENLSIDFLYTYSENNIYSLDKK